MTAPPLHPVPPRRTLGRRVPARRVVAELARAGALPRVTRWRPALAGWLGSAAVLLWKAGAVHDLAGRVTLLRVVAVLLVTGAVNLVDDDAADLLAAAPVPLAWRRGLRLGLATAAVAASWAAALLWLHPGGGPAAALSLEAAALTAFGLAVASGIARWSDAREAALAAGPAVAGAAALAILLPAPWALYTAPNIGWAQAHLRWAALLGVATAVLVPTLRDPARRRLLRRIPATQDHAAAPERSATSLARVVGYHEVERPPRDRRDTDASDSHPHAASD